MDPARKAMIQSGRRSPPRRDIASPRNDPNTRISKPTNPPPSARARQNKTSSSAYMTQDEQARKFVAEEDKFVLKQTKKKADIRVREGRAKPIDLLAYNLRFVDDDRDLFDEDEADLHVALTAPDVVLQGLDASQLRELEADIKSYHTLETNARNREYWLSLQTICSERRQKLKPQGPDDRVVSTVSSDVDKILSPKTYEQLEALEKQVKAKLQSNEDIDTDYWEQLLRSLLVWKAKAKLKKVYEAVKESRAAMLNARHPDKAHSSSDAVPGLGGASSSVRTSTGAESSSRFDTKAPVKSIIPSSAPPGTARFAQVDNEDFSQATKALYEREVARGVGEDEEVFAAEEAVTATAKPQWADKHRPRKPRYFNRVQMGYEWNKYNQTHYDHDNPPPKVVQGYKFNIFYPELIDKTKAPTFKIIREHGRKRGESFAPAGEEDTCLIRFIAGPPYEDIAFRIVDREWDYSAKKDRGFKSSFDKGILQLHFQFKKIYYRK
ncbi:hypothetical protein HYQ45_007963 [Verticillium longisporum]|uniref:Splicing factor Cactin n=1 Tax=Verticillium longisporum TaxID=100787 RepID=A0A8I2ZLE5_VERLO|nr:hypothetical protein HYQ45_007963 [Verticillium longisporum]